MIEINSLRLSSLLIAVVGLAFGVLSYFSVPFQFYLWEVFIDFKILFLLISFLILYQKKKLTYSVHLLNFVKFRWKQNIYIFFLPILLYLIPAGIGLLLKAVSMNKPDNAPTLIIATLFDIPAIYVFSITTIAIEEVIFRGILISSFLQKYSAIQSVMISSVLWVVFCMTEIIGGEGRDVVTVSTLVTFYFSLGLFCSLLAIRSKTIWIGYSFRIGIITLTPILLSSFIVESDSFISTESFVFAAEGLIISILFLVLSIILFKKTDDIQENKLLRNIS